jgi:23S rRNA A1618 N6-methylase RlmF
MCNPPFFDNTEEVLGTAQLVRLYPCVNGVCHVYIHCTLQENKGTTGELVTEGGEVAFVSRIVADSLKLKNQLRYLFCSLSQAHEIRSKVSPQVVHFFARQKILAQASEGTPAVTCGSVSRSCPTSQLKEKKNCSHCL